MPKAMDIDFNAIRRRVKSSGLSDNESYLFNKTGSHTLQIFLKLTRFIICNVVLLQTHSISPVSVSQIMEF